MLLLRKSKASSHLINSDISFLGQKLTSSPEHLLATGSHLRRSLNNNPLPCWNILEKTSFDQEGQLITILKLLQVKESSVESW